MPANEQLGVYSGPPMVWGGLKWRPAPDSADWFCWDSKGGGIFKRVRAEDVPGELFVELMKAALL